MLLWDVLARSSAVLLAAALVNASLRGRSAALRHAVWAFGLAGALAVAPLSWILPTWHVPLVPAFPASTHTTAARQMTPVDVPAVPKPALPPMPSAAELIASAEAAAPAARVEAPPARIEATAAQPAPAGREPIQVPWRLMLAGLWALGTIALLGRIARANIVTFRALRSGASTDAPWLATARRLARVSGVPRTRFIRSERISMPMAAGYLRPTVALPAEADAWPDERITSVLLHELAHIRRRDCLTQLAASTTCALYWMNPLAWHAARALRRERERACDDAVLVAGTAGPEYAEHLLDVARAARHVTTPTWSGGVAMAHRSELEGRLMAILDDARNRQSMSYGAAGLAGILCLALVTPLAALDPWVLSAAAAQPVAIPPGAGPTPKTPKAPRPEPPRAAIAGGVVAPVQLTAPEIAEEIEEQRIEVAIATSPAVPEPPTTVIDTEVALAVATATVDAEVETQVHVPMAMALAPVIAVQTLPTPAPAPSPAPTPSPSPAVAARADRERPRAREREVKPADPRVIAALGGALKDADVEVRQQAAHSLGQMRDPAAVDVLIPALQDADVEVRQNVVFALGQLRDVRAIPGLTIALKDGNEEVRERAAFALAQLRDPRAIDPLLIAARDTNSDVRKQALFAISQIDATRGKDVAIEALKDKDAEVRRMAAHLLGRLAHD